MRSRLWRHTSDMVRPSVSSAAFQRAISAGSALKLMSAFFMPRHCQIKSKDTRLFFLLQASLPRAMLGQGNNAPKENRTMQFQDTQAVEKIKAAAPILDQGEWGNGTDAVCMMSALVSGADSTEDCVTAGWPEWLVELNISLFDADGGVEDERAAALQFAMDVAEAIQTPRDTDKARDLFLIARLDTGDYSALKSLDPLEGDWSEQREAIDTVVALLHRRINGEDVEAEMRAAAEAAAEAAADATAYATYTAAARAAAYAVRAAPYAAAADAAAYATYTAAAYAAAYAVRAAAEAAADAVSVAAVTSADHSVRNAGVSDAAARRDLIAALRAS